MISLRFLLLTLTSFVVLSTAKLALPRLSSDTQRCHSPIPTGGESISSVPTRSSVQLLPVGVWLAWSGFAPFSPSSSSQSPLVDAASALVLLLRSCHRAARHTFSCSPPTGPPSSSSSPLPPFVQYVSFPLAHVLPRILVLTPQRIRTQSGPGVYRHSLSAARKVYPDRRWSRRSSSLTIRCQESAFGPRVVQAFIVTRYPPPGGRIGTPSGPGVDLHSLSTAGKAYPDRHWSRRLSSLAIRRQEGLSVPRVVQPFIFTRHPPPRRRIRTAGGPGVHFHSLSAAREAYPDRDWSRRLSSLAIRRQEGLSGPRVVQAFIFAHYPLPGRRIRTASGPGVYRHSLSAARRAYPDREWSRRLSSLAIRRQEGVSGPRVVQALIFTRYPLPGRRIRTRAVQAFIFTRYPPPGRRILTPSGPAVPLHPLSAARKAYPDRERSKRLC